MAAKDNKLKAEFFPEWETIGCPSCKSPFHEEADCPKTKVGEPKFKFRTRKEMGLEPGSLPFKFRVDIDPQVDDEVEVTRKRALLRLNSSKVYNLMGYSVKAHESQKTALQWLIRFADELDIDDEALQKERAQLIPLIQTLQDSLQTLNRIRQNKIKQAEAMEEVGTEARQKARKVRTRVAKKKAQEQEFWVLRLPDSNIDVPIVYGEEIDPANLFKEAANAILDKEK
jgi:hypothetical protein